MRHHITALALVAGASAFVSMPANAGAFAVGAKASTLGLGAEATLGITDYLNVRVPYSAFTVNYKDDDEGVAYKGDLKLNSIGAQLDLHPFKGSFYLTAGLFSNGNKIKARAQSSDPNAGYDVGDQTFYSDPTNPLTIDAKGDFKSTVPYAGLGWGNAIQGKSNFYFRFELGAYFQGAAKIDASASGRARNSQNQTFDVNDQNSAPANTFRTELEKERAELEDDASDFKVYPVLGLALGWRFKF